MKTIPTLSVEEVQNLVSFARDDHTTHVKNLKATRNTTIILLMLEAGLRVGEAVRLTVSDLFFNNEPVTWLTVRSEITKTKKERSIPVSVPLRNAIASMAVGYWRYYGLKDTDYAFAVSTKSKHITVRQIESIVKYLSMKCLKRSITPHALRHTFATRLMQKTNIRTVQQLLGHAQLSSTQIYAHPHDNDLIKAINSSMPG